MHKMFAVAGSLNIVWPADRITYLQTQQEQVVTVCRIVVYSRIERYQISCSPYSTSKHAAVLDLHPHKHSPHGALWLSMLDMLREKCNLL